MRVAVLGGSGFIGCHFVRAIRHAGHEVTVYTGSRTGLSNLCRQPIDLRFYQPSELGGLQVPDDTDLIVNFAYPSETRDGIPPEQQEEAFGNLFLRLLEERPAARLVHVSSIAVYEPFVNGLAAEEDACNPSPSDAYAWAKLRLDQRLLQAPSQRVALFRPSIVYGPFGRAFTDVPMAALAAGDLPVGAMSGRMQPVYVGDVVQVLLEECRSFRSGVFNLAGPECMTWRSYFEFLAQRVGRGRLTPADTAEAGDRGRSGVATVLGEIRDLAQVLANHSSFRSMLRRLGRRLPRPLGAYLLRLGQPTSATEIVDLRLPEPEPVAASATPPSALVRECRDWVRSGYFERDRRVSETRLVAAFPEVLRTPLMDTAGELERYFRFRFTDDLLETNDQQQGSQGTSRFQG